MSEHCTKYWQSPTYKAWAAAKSRCRCETSSVYKDYGERGITFAPEWDDFNQFLADMGVRPDGLSLDRIDNSKGYRPDNCRWATPKEQAYNRRDNRLHEHDGKTLTLEEWATETGIKRATLFTRLHRGWSLERALTTPTG